MARQAITLQNASDAGVVPAEIVGHVDGHAFVNDAHTIIVIKNSGAGAHVVTVQTPYTVNGLAVAERTLSVPAGATRVMGPFRKTLYNQLSPNETKVYVDFDATPAEVLCSYIKVGTAA